jgi:sialidase-1
MVNNKITLAATGLVYRNPKPHLRSIHAWHPSAVRLEDGTLMCAFDLGEAVESLDYRTHTSRSTDGAATWTSPVPLFHDVTQRPATHSVRICRTRDGTLVGLGGRFYRDTHPDEGLLNRENLGHVPMDLLLLKSSDAGVSWEGPHIIHPPLIGPAFEICHTILELPKGRWLAPISTYRGWNGEAPNGMKAIALVSHDQGKSWPEYLDVMDGTREQVIHFEQSITRLQDGRLLAVAWAFHEPTGTTRSTPYALSRDGQPFSKPRPTGLKGQTAKVICLEDGRILCVYRRNDQPGLWANLSRLEGDEWVNLSEARMWQGAASGMSGKLSAADELGSLKFGFPNLLLLPGGKVFAVFWCCEDCVWNIRWLRIHVQ